MRREALAVHLPHFAPTPTPLNLPSMAAQPKKAATAYFLWLSDNREAIQKELGSKLAPAVSKMAGERWAKLPADTKAPYEAKARLAKADYDKAMESFKAEGGLTAPRKRKGGAMAVKAPKDPNVPKKPAGGGYGVFLSMHREELVKSLPKGHKVTDVSKAAGERWKLLTEADKRPYNEEFAAKMAMYKKALEEWKDARPTEGGADDQGQDDVEDEEGEGEDAGEGDGEPEVKEPPARQGAVKRVRKAGA